MFSVLHNMKNDEKLREFIKNNKKTALIVVLGITAIIMLALSEILPSRQNKSSDSGEATTSSYADYEAQTEKRLCEIIAQIDGAGKTQVMVSLKTGEEFQYAENSSSDRKSGSDANNEVKSENEYVVIDGEKGDGCVLLKSNAPVVQGVIVVCQGGEDKIVKNNITNAVASLLGISSNSITVLKMKNTEE